MNRFEHANGVVTLGFESLTSLPVHAHVATRHGGVSPEPWHSLNFSVTRGDTPERVAENRLRLASALDVDAARVVRCSQVHGTNVRQVEHDDAGTLQPASDGLMTRTRGLPIALVFADCVPVLLYDAKRNVLAACHAGWRGTVAGAAVATLTAMQQAYATDPRDVRVGIGPSIGPTSYQVGEEVRTAAHQGLPFAESCFAFPSGASGKAHFDLWSANRLQLEAAGVSRHNIEVAEIDTARNTHDFFSHRGEQGRCGLFCMIAWLD